MDRVKRDGRGSSLQEVTCLVAEVESGLDALRELLTVTNGASINASSVDALLQPIHAKLQAAATNLHNLHR